MAPKKDKEKVEKVSGDAAIDTVLNYLRKQNRPYSATDISANLHNKVTKALAAKILKDLHEKKAIEGRGSGKSFVYHVIQDTTKLPTPEALAELNDSANALRTEITSLQSTLKQLKGELSSLETTSSIDDLRVSLTSLESQRNELYSRLELLKGGTAEPISREARDLVVKEICKWKKIVDRRRRILRDVWDVISDGMADSEGVDLVDLRERFGV